MQIDGHTQVYGLLGYPVGHTLSPVIHNNLAQMRGDNLAYLPFLTAPGELQAAVKGAYALNLQGLNVTVPHKEKVIPFLKEIDGLADQIGAVNTLVRVDGGFKGYNTDMPGLYRAMRSDGVNIEGEEIVILGAGGVARAVAVLLGEKAKTIYLLNRTIGKAEKIAAEVNGYAGREVVKPMALADYDKLPESSFLVIQTTNVGMHPDCDRAVIEDAHFYERVHTGYDLIFNPAETFFMKKVKLAGGKAYNGLKMLLYQGIIAYELWNECSISETQAEEIYERLRTSL